MYRRAFLASAAAALFAGWTSAHFLSAVLDEVAALPNLRAVVALSDGETMAARGYGGFTPASATNIKSASKAVISALVGVVRDGSVCLHTFRAYLRAETG